MKEEYVRAFLGQFAESRKNIETWPSWMRESAITASASFPKSGEDSETKRELSSDHTDDGS